MSERAFYEHSALHEGGRAPRRIHIRSDARALREGRFQRRTATTIDAESLLPHPLSDAPDPHNAHRDGKRARRGRRLPPYSGTRVTGRLSEENAATIDVEPLPLHPYATLRARTA